MATSWDFYDENGLEYTRLQIEHAAGELEADRKIMRQLFAEKGCLEGLTIDVGCGAGLDLGAWINLGASHVIGVEPSRLLEEAKRRASQVIGDVRTLKGGWDLLPVPTSVASCVIARYSLHLARKLSVAFAETARVLKPGGWFIFSVPHPDYHAQLVREGRQTPDGQLMSSLFGGRITVPNPTHSKMEDYLTPARAHFDTLECIPYNDTGVVTGNRGISTGMVCAYRRRLE